jgi:hypothetical protein
MINCGKPLQHVVISRTHWLADGIRAHGVFTRCAIRVGLAWTTVGRLVSRGGGQDRRRWGAGAPPVLPAWGTVLGGLVPRADALLWSRADHADKTTAGQTVTVGEAQSVPRYSGIEYSKGN